LFAQLKEPEIFCLGQVLPAGILHTKDVNSIVEIFLAPLKKGITYPEFGENFDNLATPLKHVAGLLNI
jgi:hypothetical protein